MHQTILCNWLTKGALAVAVVVGGAGSAFAGWGHHGWGGSSGGSWGGSSGGSSGGYYGGSSGGWGSSGGYSYGGSSGGSSGGWGRGGLFHHHRRWGGSSCGSSGGYYGGSSGGWGSSGGYSYGGSSGGSSGGWGSSGGTIYGGGYYSPSVVMPQDDYYGPAKSAPPANIPPADGSPVAPPPADDTAPPPAPAPGGSTSINRADGMLIVEVPADAKIYVNGRLTSTPGEVREYVSRNLTHGYNYAYEVRAEVQRGGQTITDTKRIDLRAGESTKLAFNLAPTTEVETSITVKVPANAKVNLGGNDTNLQGETRVFRTSALKAGAEWKSYTIVATLEVDGREITKEQSIDVKAGENKEVAFDFDTTSVAAR
jgi:uncharacterized protein (TIGR03000 family)